MRNPELFTKTGKPRISEIEPENPEISGKTGKMAALSILF
jgi:hypothetical protein